MADRHCRDKRSTDMKACENGGIPMSMKVALPEARAEDAFPSASDILLDSSASHMPDCRMVLETTSFFS